jgi:hypothetical protein
VAADGSVCTGPTGDAKSDVLIFTLLNIDADGFGYTRIDFLSDNEDPFFFPTDFNVLEVGPEGSNGAVYEALPDPPPPGLSQEDFERMTYNIISDTKSVPEPSSTFGLLALSALGAASALKRKPKPSKSPEKKDGKSLLKTIPLATPIVSL